MNSFFGIAAALSKNCLLIEKAVFADTCTVVRRLCAELAVLGTSAASAVDYAAKVGVVALEVTSYHISALAELFEVRSDEEGLVFGVGEPFSADYFFREFYHIHSITSVRICGHTLHYWNKTAAERGCKEAQNDVAGEGEKQSCDKNSAD